MEHESVEYDIEVADQPLDGSACRHCPPTRPG
jgi:hypothetical protein